MSNLPVFTFPRLDRVIGSGPLSFPPSTHDLIWSLRFYLRALLGKGYQRWAEEGGRKNVAQKLGEINMKGLDDKLHCDWDKRSQIRCNLNCMIIGKVFPTRSWAWQIASALSTSRLKDASLWHHNAHHLILVHRKQEQGHIPHPPSLLSLARWLLFSLFSARPPLSRSHWRFCFLRDELLS